MEGADGGNRFRLLVRGLHAKGSWIFYRRPAKTVARPEPLAGIIPLDLSSCNLPFSTRVFVLKNARSVFHYADEGLEAGSGRKLLPEIVPVVSHLRRSFLRHYLDRLRDCLVQTEGGRRRENLFFLNLLVTNASLLSLLPDETEEALAGDPAELAWEAGFVPLYLPPGRLRPGCRNYGRTGCGAD